MRDVSRMWMDWMVCCDDFVSVFDSMMFVFTFLLLFLFVVCFDSKVANKLDDERNGVGRGKEGLVVCK